MQTWRHICLAGIMLLLTSCSPGGEGETLEAQQATLPTASQPNMTSHADVASVEPTNLTAIPKRKPADCPVTQPPEPPFTPPPPHAPAAQWSGWFWYGTNFLWTRIPKDGEWAGLRHNPEGYTQKVFWWREDYDWMTDPRPQLTVTGRRLDAPAPSLTASRATNAYAEDIKSAMLVGVTVPTPGCWEITGKVADQELSFVIWVGP